MASWPGGRVPVVSQGGMAKHKLNGGGRNESSSQQDMSEAWGGKG